ncbi:MAG: hypothetical protein Q8P46_17910 [Hyphomicrobiales bacterium]|nr:hypothetical protein [Hyphomicrobiales bacterium]
MCRTAKLKKALLILGLAAGLLALAPSHEALAACLSAGPARAVIASGQVLPLSSIASTLRRRYSVDVIGGQLCEGGSGYVYELKVLGPGGRADRVVVDARSGQLLSGNLGR